MDSQETVGIAVRLGEDTPILTYPKLFTLDQFKERYGEDNCTIMLQDRENELYKARLAQYAQDFNGEADFTTNLQVALDAWKPCDDRPPTAMEARAQEILNLSPQAQAVFIRHITAGIAKQKQEQAAIDAGKADEQVQAIQDRFQPPADVGPPVTEPQQAPPIPTSFEQIGADADRAAENAKAIQATLAGHAEDIEAGGEDFQAPTAFEEGGNEDAIVEEPGQTEVGMPPPATE